MRVCVCTSNRADSEPRAPRHACAIADLKRVEEVIFLECVPTGERPSVLPEFESRQRIKSQVHWYPQRATQPLRTLIGKAVQRLATGVYRANGTLLPCCLSSRVLGVTRRLERLSADVYVAHNIDMLLPAATAATRTGAKLVFDSMELHADMGDGQSTVESSAIRAIETATLNKCVLTLASSAELAAALEAAYGIARPLAIYNAGPTVLTMPPKLPESQLSLYWRNSVLGLSQRGLEDALVALSMIQDFDVALHLRGRLETDGGQRLRARIVQLGIERRVVIHPPHGRQEAVAAAAPYHVGLCLERSGVGNHEVAVSNKLFDYMMAGLAVVASDQPALRSTVEQSQSGLLYRAGDTEQLAGRIRELAARPDLRRSYADRARRFALSVGNEEAEMMKLRAALASVLSS